MNTTIKRPAPAWNNIIIFLPASLLVFFVIIALDFATASHVLWTAPRPQLAGLELIHTLALAVSALLLVRAVISMAPSGREEPALVVDLKITQIVIPTPAILLVTFLLPLAFALLLVANPTYFTQLSNEDSFIEMGSSLLLFFACANFIILLLKLRRASSGAGRFYLVGLASLAFAVFLIGMEEVSWFQRSFGIQTPEAFSGNKQNEMNLHNFASNASEIGYYFGSFALFLLFPFVYDHWRFLAKNKIASFFAPSLTVLLASIPVMAFNYNLWNHPVTQFTFFATLFILIYYTFRTFTTPAAPLRGIRYYLLALCLLYPAMQIIFLGWGGSLSKGWEVTEYKEFLIPLTFFIYSLGLVIKVEKRVGLKYGAAGLAITLVFLLLRVMQSLQN